MGAREKFAIHPIIDALMNEGAVLKAANGSCPCEDEIVLFFQNQITWHGDNPLVNGKPLADVIRQSLKAHPHWQPIPLDSDVDLNNLTERAKFFNGMRPDLIADYCRAWGLRGPGDTRPGKRPENTDGKKSPPDRNNPWDREAQGIIDPKTGRYSAAALTAQSRLVRADPKAAARIAAAANSFIGATK